LSVDRPGSPNIDRDAVAADVHTVLLAEDEEVLREIAAIKLRSAGHVVLEAGSTGAALEAVSRTGRPIDVLVTDVMLPEIGGVLLFEQLHRSYPEMKAVFISGHSIDVIFENAPLPSGAAFLEKPYDSSTLLATVAELLHG
jgi:two-component system cell cycle sensor histidine kinase/response regulator CckA